VPSYAAQMMLKEQITVEGEVADYKLSGLATGECVALLFKGSGVAVLVCNVGDGVFRFSAKPIPPTMRKGL
jgi:hypothetical protein